MPFTACWSSRKVKTVIKTLHTCTFLPVAASVRRKPRDWSRYLEIHMHQEMMNLKRKCLPKYPPCGYLLNVPDLLVDVWPVRRLVEAFDVVPLNPQRCWIKQRLLYCGQQYVAKMTFRLILLFSPDTLQSDSSVSEALERRNLKETSSRNLMSEEDAQKRFSYLGERAATSQRHVEFP